MNYIERLAAITDADEQMELVEPLAEELLDDPDARTAEITVAILQMFERNYQADGFGTFSTFNMVLEEVDPEMLRPLLRASLDRQSSWPAEELWTLFEEEGSDDDYDGDDEE